MPLPGYGKSPAGIKTNTPAGKAREEKVGNNGQRLITIDDMFAEISSRLANIEGFMRTVAKISEQATPKFEVVVKKDITPVEEKQTPWIEVPSAADVILAAKDFHTKNGTEGLKVKLGAFGVRKVSELKDEDFAAFLSSLK